MKECYSIKSLLEQKVNLCFSTDAPATSWAVPSDPFVCIKGAVTRKAYDGTDCGDDQIIDMKTAIILYTKIVGGNLFSYYFFVGKGGGSLFTVHIFYNQIVLFKNF